MTDADRELLAPAPAANQPPRALSAYNVFMKSEVAKVKQEHPSLPHREAFKMAAERWQASPMNPQNGGDRFPQKAAGGATGGAAADAAEDDVQAEAAATGERGDNGDGAEGAAVDAEGAGAQDQNAGSSSAEAAPVVAAGTAQMGESQW
jgi:hypothetical protein